MAGWWHVRRIKGRAFLRTAVGMFWFYPLLRFLPVAPLAGELNSYTRVLVVGVIDAVAAVVALLIAWQLSKGARAPPAEEAARPA